MRARYAAWPLGAKVLLCFVVAMIVLPVLAFFAQRLIDPPTAEPAVLLIGL